MQKIIIIIITKIQSLCSFIHSFILEMPTSSLFPTSSSSSSGLHSNQQHLNHHHHHNHQSNGISGILHHPGSASSLSLNSLDNGDSLLNGSSAAPGGPTTRMANNASNDDRTMQLALELALLQGNLLFYYSFLSTNDGKYDLN